MSNFFWLRSISPKTILFETEDLNGDVEAHRCAGTTNGTASGWYEVYHVAGTQKRKFEKIYVKIIQKV